MPREGCAGWLRPAAARGLSGSGGDSLVSAAGYGAGHSCPPAKPTGTLGCRQPLGCGGSAGSHRLGLPGKSLSPVQGMHAPSLACAAALLRRQLPARRPRAAAPQGRWLSPASAKGRPGRAEGRGEPAGQRLAVLGSPGQAQPAVRAPAWSRTLETRCQASRVALPSARQTLQHRDI